jgi:predicted transcriptional regulator
MAQGKAFTNEQRETIIQSLREYLELGFSRNKACEIIGLAPSTLSNWVKDDEALGIKLQGWENAINKVAMQNILDAINKEGEADDTRKETTKWWLERKMKADFSTRTDITTNDEKIESGVVILPSKDES